ncbi:MAG: chromate transporter [Oscillospiraceae bacterium]|nr:chromate transporter [Oscillospiraceae bacterium]
MIFWQLFFTFFRIGLFTIGGGYAMIPMIEDEVVRQSWLTHTQLVDFIAVAESTPGPFAVNTATYVGMTTGANAGGSILSGLLGAFLATLGVVLPSFLIILLVAKCFTSFQENRLVKGALYGMHPAVVGLIMAAALSLAKGNLYSSFSFASLSAFFSSFHPLPIVIFLTVLAISFWKKKLHPVKLILLSAVLGILCCGIQDLLLQ